MREKREGVILSRKREGLFGKVNRAAVAFSTSDAKFVRIPRTGVRRDRSADYENALGRRTLLLNSPGLYR